MADSMCHFRTWRWAVVVAAVWVAATACGGADESEDGSESTDATTAETSSAAADPLEGDWRAEFSCRESEAAVTRVLAASEIRRQGWEPDCSPRDTLVHLARFKDGVLVLCREEPNVCEVHASYEVVGASQVLVEDPEGNLCEGAGCQVEWKFRVEGDTVRFEVQDDAWVLSTWQVVPFERID